MRHFRHALIVLATTLLIGLAASGAGAVQPDEVLKDPALERRAREISTVLRCLVCQNQSIDDSDAPLAKDLRVLVRERLRAGDTDAEVRDFVVRRYGEFVMLRPVFSSRTALLWFAPLVVFLGGGLAAFAAVRRGRRGNPAPLTSDERAALDSILRER